MTVKTLNRWQYKGTSLTEYSTVPPGAPAGQRFHLSSGKYYHLTGGWPQNSVWQTSIAVKELILVSSSGQNVKLRAQDQNAETGRCDAKLFQSLIITRLINNRYCNQQLSWFLILNGENVFWGCGFTYLYLYLVVLDLRRIKVWCRVMLHLYQHLFTATYISVRLPSSTRLSELYVLSLLSEQLTSSYSTCSDHNKSQNHIIYYY